MAAGNKTTAVHFTLIFFVMLSVILGVVSYMFYNSDKEKFEKIGRNINELKKAKALAITRDQYVQDLKKEMGYTQNDIGTAANPDEGSVLKAAADDIKKYGGDLADASLAATLRKLRQELNSTVASRDALQKNLNQQKTQNTGLKSTYQVQVDEQTKAVVKAEEERANEQAKRQEEIAAKNDEIDQLRKNISQVQVEMEQLREQQVNELEERDTKIKRLIAINDKLRGQIDDLENISFDEPDGVIRSVDNVHGIVWINLGKTDKLPKRTTFSVYRKDNTGVGRGDGDIKGAIEVTRLLGPHLAECRVTEDDIYNPISPGDPIFTPLWSVGIKEKFSFVGLIDLDGDGKTKLDRPRLHEFIEAAGAEIDNEVLDDGTRVGNGISVKTKYLVIGIIPTLDDITGDNDTQEAIEAIIEEHKILKQEAREQGVRTISLKDFLAYIGYKPTQRVWIPGEDVPWLLKAGSQSPSVNETIGKRESTVRTAGTYSRSKRLKQQTSTGRTSQQFRGGSYGK